MFGKKIRIESRMLNCTHIFEIDKNLLSRNPKMEQYLLWIFMFGTKIKNVELYTSFRICAFPLRAQRQQSNLITPPNVWQKNQNRIKKIRKYKNTAFVFAPFGRDLRVNGGGEETNSWMCVKPNIFHSNLTFGGVGTHFLELYTNQRFSIYPDIRTKHLCVVCLCVWVCVWGGGRRGKNTEIQKHSFCLCTLWVFKEWMGEVEKPILECL